MNTLELIPRDSAITELLKQNKMNYKGFDIIKKSAGLFWVICSGFMLGSSSSIEGAHELIDNFIYQSY